MQLVKEGHDSPRTIFTDLTAALTKVGIWPDSPLRRTREVYHDDHTLFVKPMTVFSSQGSLTDTYAILKSIERAGVPFERLIGPGRIGTQHPEEESGLLTMWVVVDHVDSDGRSPFDVPEQVGRIMRVIHDDVWPFDRERSEQEVYCVRDWHRDNIIVTRDGPVRLDVDCGSVGERWRQVGLGVGEFASLHSAAGERFLSGYNHDGAYSSDANFKAVVSLYR